MSRINEMSMVIEELRNCANSLNETATFLAGTFGGVEAKEPEKVVTLEEVRAVLATKSQDGLTVQVKELIQKHGGTKLSNVDPKNYAKLLSDAEVL